MVAFAACDIWAPANESVSFVSIEARMTDQSNMRWRFGTDSSGVVELVRDYEAEALGRPNADWPRLVIEKEILSDGTLKTVRKYLVDQAEYEALVREDAALAEEAGR